MHVMRIMTCHLPLLRMVSETHTLENMMTPWVPPILGYSLKFLVADTDSLLHKVYQSWWGLELWASVLTTIISAPHFEWGRPYNLGALTTLHKTGSLQWAGFTLAHPHSLLITNELCLIYPREHNSQTLDKFILKQTLWGQCGIQTHEDFQEISAYLADHVK